MQVRPRRVRGPTPTIDAAPGVEPSRGLLLMCLFGLNGNLPDSVRLASLAIRRDLLSVSVKGLIQRPRIGV
jgi:hypothetical protein